MCIDKSRTYINNNSSGGGGGTRYIIVVVEITMMMMMMTTTTTILCNTVMPVVGRLTVPKQTKESARRDVIYCIGQKHLLVGASQSTICLYCVKQLSVYFRKHLLT